ncbi:DUF6542 domain-containing protein [Mycolicibacterium fallax]|uniref:DUF6542 domain-containing protein n=2 Tax=Mycolicibacterium fallax TaxID=1793 RepID=UPI00105569B6|nr:DUF6542 domain-containing protein [Mycolicibacterium fallax]
MPAQRARPSIAAEDASAHPAINGVQWWAAVLIACTATLLGIAFDSVTGSGELSVVFAVLYFLGCVAAALMVRQSGLFTAVVQPPIILFVAVPSAYYLFHHASIQGLKDILINCGYPLIDRFLLMFTTSVVVLLIGMARWYFGSRRPDADVDSAAEPTSTGALGVRAAALLAGATAAIKHAVDSIRGGATDEEDEEAVAPRRAARTDTGRRRANRPASARSRHARPPMDDRGAPEPRRRRHAAAADLDEYGEPPRRRRPAGEQDVPARRRRAPGDPEGYPSRRRDEQDPYAPPPRRRPPPEGYRREDPRRGYEGYRPPAEGYRPPAPGYRRDPEEYRRGEQSRPRPRPHRYLEDAPAEPPRRRPTGGANGGHHPVSRVRYRGEDTPDSGAPDPRPSRHSRGPRD